MLLSLFPFVFLVAGCYGAPTGAPAIACEDMFPVGHNASAQTSPPPYMMMVMAMDDHYMVTLSGAADTTFRGFYVQARLMGGGTTPQGVMQPDHDDTNAQFTECGGVQNGAATHVSNNDKTSVTFSWYPTDVDPSMVMFYGTVVQVLDTFWTDLTAMPM